MVGSFPRPRWLIEAFEKSEKTELRGPDLDEYVNDAVKLTLKEQESAGLDVITDGEQRRSSFVSFVGQRIPGFKLVRITDLNPNAKEVMKKYGAELTLWRAVADNYVRDSTLAADELEFTKKFTSRPIKVTLPSPYLLMWETWHSDISKPFYDDPEGLAEDCVKVVRNEILRLRDGGAAFVQLDEPMLGDLVEASEGEPDRYRKVAGALYGQKYRGFKNEVCLARDLVNETVKGIDGVKLGMHLDRWPRRDSPYYGVGYEKLLPEVLDIKVKQYVLEYSSPDSGDPTKFLEHLPSDREIGLGVIGVINRQVEDPADVAGKVERITKIVDPNRIWLNPDCGFAPGMYRTFPRSVAFEKVKSMVGAAHILREKYGEGS